MSTMASAEPSGPAQYETGERPLLIKLDRGFIMRIEAEREVLTGGTGHKLPRTAMIRMLLKEALDARARARNEKVPTAVVVPRSRDGELEGDAA
jgi:hypothetical protein